MRDYSANARDQAVEAGHGLFRTVLAGCGGSLLQAFTALERLPRVQCSARHDGRDLFGARVNLGAQEGVGYWELTRVREEIYVIVENFAYREPRFELVPGDGTIQFYFKLSGDLTLATDQCRSLPLDRPGLLVWSQPEGIDAQEWTAPRARELCIAISVRPAFLSEHISCAVDPPAWLKSFIDGGAGQLHYRQLPLSAPMVELVSRLVKNPFSGALGLVHTEALALELLCHALACENAAVGVQQCTKRQLECVHAARDYLATRFVPVPTIRQVAREVGMNESTLNAAFKQAFGETLFDYSLRCRMQQALHLLRDQRLSVARVAELVGYRHQTSFATAFLRYFGMRPKDVRGAAGLAASCRSPVR